MSISSVWLSACVVAMTQVASAPKPVDVAAQARGAASVFVGTVVDVKSRFDTNAYGDQLIVSDLSLQVSETLKGGHSSSATMTIEGGRIGELSLSVSDIPAMKAGERGVFFLNVTPSGEHVPYNRGQGILKLDHSDRVEGGAQTLAEIRRAVQNALR